MRFFQEFVGDGIASKNLGNKVDGTGSPGRDSGHACGFLNLSKSFHRARGGKNQEIQSGEGERRKGKYRSPPPAPDGSAFWRESPQ